MLATAESPTPIFFDFDGKPLDEGSLYFGSVNQNPVTAQIPVFWDAAGTQPAAQPIKTLNGYPVRFGTPANVYVNTGYSISVYDKRGRLIVTFPDAAQFGSQIFKSDLLGAVGRPLDSKLSDWVSVKDFGAVLDNVTDDSAAFNAAFAVASHVIVPAGTARIASAVTVPLNVLCEFMDSANINVVGGGSWTVTPPTLISSSAGKVTRYETFAPIGDRRTYRNQGVAYQGDSINTPITKFGAWYNFVAPNGQNSLMGGVSNNRAAGDYAFPCGVTAYGANFSAGNSVFGLYAEAIAGAAGVVTNEIDSFNNFGPPQSTFPPNRAFGQAVATPIALTLGAGGTFASTCAIDIVQEGSAPNQFYCGFYGRPGAIIDYGVLIDANVTQGANIAGSFRVFGNPGPQFCLQTKFTNAAPSASSRHLTCTDSTGAEHFGIAHTGKIILGSFNTTSSASAGGATALPATPAGYLTVSIAGTDRKLPYYA